MLTRALGVPERALRGFERKIYVKVRQVLWDYEPLRASHAEIAIEVRERDVRLTGRVRTLPQKTIAGVLAKRVEDIDTVDNALVADTEVIRAVANALAADERTASHVLLVDARHGLVVLRGEVPNEDTRLAALETTSGVPLVAAVRDRMVVSLENVPPLAQSRRSDALAANVAAETAVAGRA